jgi:hypothetical protein
MKCIIIPAITPTPINTTIVTVLNNSTPKSNETKPNIIANTGENKPKKIKVNEIKNCKNNPKVP